ncbi:MAG: hypothetical protein KXJ53_02105, partial [Phenylobacterium sp.]|nr:hypothetical protein [Phenylobacterium sp.]
MKALLPRALMCVIVSGSRVRAAHERCRQKGIRIGRPPIPPIRLQKVEKALKDGQSIRAVAA